MGTGKLRWQGVRTPQYTYVEYPNGEKELYDNQADPYQLECLHRTAEPSLLKGLQGQLEALGDCSGEECRTAEDRTLGSAGP
jgi:N-acetylglucosamine-6-sulfatase